METMQFFALLSLLLALPAQSQPVCTLLEKASSYDNETKMANVSVVDFRDLTTPGCKEQCRQALNDKCSYELIQCRAGGTFELDLCQSKASCNIAIGDSKNRYVQVSSPDSEAWNYQANILRCGCSADRYSHSCEHVRPGMCDVNASEVWDGTYINSAWFKNPAVQHNVKEATCFLDQSQEGIITTVTSGIRHHRVNITLGQYSNSQDAGDGVNITWALTSRFRPQENVHNHNGDPQSPPWATYCLPCNLDPHGPDAPCNNRPHSAQNAGPITCLSGGGWVANSTDPRWQQCEVPKKPYIEDAHEGIDTYVGGECCGPAEEWMKCTMGNCQASCSESGAVTYTCPETYCVVKQPKYIYNPASQWDFLNQLPTLTNGHLTTTMDFQVDYLTGVAKSTVTFPNKNQPDQGFVWKQICMRGSCIASSDLPQNTSMTNHTATMTPIITQDPGCNGRYAPPSPPPKSSERSVSLLALVSIFCGVITVTVFAFLVFVKWEAARLAPNFTWAELVFRQENSRRLSDMRAIEAAQQQQDMSTTALLYHGQHDSSLPPPYDSEAPPYDSDAGLITTQGVGLMFDQVGYAVGSRMIVSSISGVIHPGSMVGLLGPSGAGKSSFLDIAAGRVKVGQVFGTTSMFHQDGHHKEQKANIAYVLQDDVLVTTDTVAETLLFAARLKNPGISLQECQDRVSKVLSSLKLDHIANSYIGNGVEGGGISGGERKRVSIGVELVSTPSCLILDEPTSGLDSNSTIVVLEVLRKVADEGCAVLFSIHQPSLKAFLLFDKILLLSCHGTQLFLGPPAGAVGHFRSIAQGDSASQIFSDTILQQLLRAGTPRLDGGSYENPAELLLDAASEQHSESLDMLTELFFASKIHHNTLHELELLYKQSAHPISEWEPQKSATPGTATWLLLKRSARSVFRDPMLLVGHLLVTGLIAGCIAIFARDLPLDFVGVQTRVFLFNFLVLYLSMVATSSMGALIKERSVFVRERTAHYYPAWCYWLTKFICDLIPLRTLPTILLAYVLYWPIGLRDSDSAFCKFLLSLLMANYTAATTSLFFSALCKDVGQANLWAASYTIYAFIFSGMLLTGGGPESRYVRYSSVFFFPWEAMCGAEFSNTATVERQFLFNPKIGGQYVIPGPTGGMLEKTEAIMDNFNLENRFTFDMMMLAGYICLFSICTLAILTFRRFAK